MNIYKRDASGPYWYKFNYKGQRVRKSSGVYNKQDAKDIASAYRTKLAKGEVGITEPEEPEPIPRFPEAMQDFLDWAETQYASHPATHRRYKTSGKALLAFFGHTPIDRIKSDDVEKFKTWRIRQKKRAPFKKVKKHGEKASKTTKNLRPATVNRELACLKHLFSRNEALVPQNPVRKVRFLEEDNNQTRVLTAEEERLYLLAASQPLRDIAIVMLDTGMRPEEACRMQSQHVDLDRECYFNPYGKTKAARRTLRLSPRALEVVNRRIDKDYLFPGRVEDAPIVKVNAAHTAAVKRSGVKPFTLYALRHTFATRAAMAGVDLVTLAAMLGHSRIHMVLRYAHPTEEHQFAAMDKIQRYSAR